MAWPAATDNVAGVKATWDKLDGTFKRDVDSKLWPALQAKSPILDMTPRFAVSNFKFEWESDVAPTRLYQIHGSSGGSGLGHATNTEFILAAAPADLQVGSIVRNATLATPIGTYGVDELMEVTAISSATLTCARNVNAAVGATAANGSTAHAVGHYLEVVYSPREEGSAPGVNKYKDVVLAENYANTVDFYLTATGDQLATMRLVGGDTMDNQFQKNMTNLTNQLEGMLFYGALNAGANAGSASYVRRTKGLDQFISAAGANLDYATKDVTPEALDALFYEILADNTDPNDRFVIACHPSQARKISAFGVDKVRLGQTESKYGRYIDTFKSDLGVEAPVIWSLNVSKSDLFILNMNRISIATFRPFEQAQWTYGDDGVDAFRQRIIGSFGVKCVDALKAHAKLGYLTW